LTWISRSCVIRPIDAVDVLCAQLTRDLFAIAKFLLIVDNVSNKVEFTKFGHTFAIIQLLIYLLFTVKIAFKVRLDTLCCSSDQPQLVNFYSKTILSEVAAGV